MLNKYNDVDHAIVHSEEFIQLLGEILERQLQPQDAFEIAALLESMGWNDTRATKQFGVENIFILAELMWSEIQAKLDYQTFSKMDSLHWSSMFLEMLRSFLRGLIFAFPMAISVAAMLNLKFSLWSYQYLSLENATAIAIGTILSFIVVGGFTQAIARRGFFYMIQGYFNLARQTTFLFIRIGFISCFVISLLVVIVNVIFNLFPFSMIFLIVIFFFFLTTIWLSVTVMYILKKELTFTGIIILGIFFVYILFRVMHIDIIISQIISLSVVSLVSFLLVLYYFLTAEKKGEKGIALKLPRFSITLYSVWPYFLYGFLYFSFLFVDRINAWSRNEEYMPYFIWFRGQYELGLDFALLTIIIPMGVSEVIVSKLMIDIEASQKKYFVMNSHELYKVFLSKYRKMSLFIMLSSVISALAIYKFILWYNSVSIRLNNENILNSEITLFVLFWGVVSYIILAFCLMNAVILFALSQPHLILKSMIPALLVNMVSGFLLSRWISYEYAVIGLLLGTIVLIVLSSRSVLKVLKNLDYYLYAAS